MHRWLMPMLRCPTHRRGLDLCDERAENDVIVAGTLQCPDGCRFPIRDAIPDFVPGDQYVESFSTQRRLLKRSFDGYVGGHSGDDLAHRSRIPPEEFARGVTLDAGCGYGRYCRFVLNAGGTVVGVDLSMTSLRLVRELLGDHPRLALVHGNLYELPFADGAFDRVISIGVLHHTPSTREGFRRINRFVKPGGKCCIFVYERYSLMRKMVDVHRHWTTRIPEGLLIILLSLNQILFHWLRKIPGIGRVVYALFPCDIGKPRWRQRITMDFDAYSPTYAYSHSHDEVYDWFVEDGFTDVRLGRAPIWVVGTRATPAPASVERSTPQREPAAV